MIRGGSMAFGQLLAPKIWSNIRFVPKSIRFVPKRCQEESKGLKTILRVGSEMFKKVPRLQQQS